MKDHVDLVYISLMNNDIEHSSTCCWYSNFLLCEAVIIVLSLFFFISFSNWFLRVPYIYWVWILWQIYVELLIFSTSLWLTFSLSQWCLSMNGIIHINPVQFIKLFSYGLYFLYPIFKIFAYPKIIKISAIFLFRILIILSPTFIPMAYCECLCLGPISFSFIFYEYRIAPSTINWKVDAFSIDLQ